MPHASTLQREETLSWLNRLVIACLAAGSARALRTGHALEGSLAGRATYAWGATRGCADRALPLRRTIDARLQASIRAELCRQLAARGYSPTAVGNARLLLTCFTGCQHDQVTSGEWTRGSSGAAAVTAPVSIVIHLRDPRSRDILWLGWAKTVISACAERDMQIADVVRRLLAALPAARP